MPLVLWHTCALNTRLLVAARKCALTVRIMEAPRASLVSGVHVQHNKCALVLLLMPLVLWHKRALNKRLLVAARKCALTVRIMEAPRASLVSSHLHSLQHNKRALVRPLIGHKSARVLSITLRTISAHLCHFTSAHLFYTTTHLLPQPVRRCALLTSGC
jgi:hypothetical protein